MDDLSGSCSCVKWLCVGSRLIAFSSSVIKVGSRSRQSSRATTGSGKQIDVPPSSPIDQGPRIAAVSIAMASAEREKEKSKVHKLSLKGSAKLVAEFVSEEAEP